MRYASICDGIGAAHAAWMPLGWQCAWVSEIEPFPIAVVEHRAPGLPNLGDMTRITKEAIDAHGRIDALVGGTPCQSFSVAGLRGGLADARGNLALRFMQLVGVLRPSWVVWENVPGVLSSNRGRDFGAILGALDELGYGWAYRVLDAQFYGVPQRRRRVFVVASARDWRRAAAVLFEREGMRRNPPTSRAAGASVARSLTSSTGGASAKEQQHTFVGGDGEPLNALRSSWWDGGQLSATIDARIDQHRMPDKGRFPAVIEPYVKLKRAQGVDLYNQTLTGDGHAPLRTAGGHGSPAVMQSMAVRRLTPLECERLQGFPDGWTQIPWRRKRAEECPDGPRYRALGNSMAVPVIRWIGERIAAVEAIR